MTALKGITRARSTGIEMWEERHVLEILRVPSTLHANPSSQDFGIQALTIAPNIWLGQGLCFDDGVACFEVD